MYGKKNLSMVTDSLPTFHAYLTLPGSFIVHPFLLFCYKDFSQDIIKKMKLIPITEQEAENTRCLINTSPPKGQEEDIFILLDISPRTPY